MIGGKSGAFDGVFLGHDQRPLIVELQIGSAKGVMIWVRMGLALQAGNAQLFKKPFGVANRGDGMDR